MLKRAREHVVPTGPDKAAAAASSLQRDLRRFADAEQVLFLVVLLEDGGPKRLIAQNHIRLPRVL